MNTALPTGTRGRAIALAILVLPLLLLWRYALAPAWHSYSDIGLGIEEARFQIQRYQGLAQRLPQLEKQAGAVTTARPLAGYLMEGENRALAAANLQRRLQQDVRRHNGRILSARVVKAVADGPFERVTVDVRAQLPLAGLQGFLHALETGKPYLFIDTMNVSARPARRRGKPTAPEMDLRLTLYGLRPLRPQEGQDV